MTYTAAVCSQILPFTLLAAASLPQAPLTVHSTHVLAADGASFREAVIELDGDEIRDVREPRAGEKCDRELGDAFVIPGLIDLHTHMLLHPYDEASWDHQVLQESLELRSMRATKHAAATLLAGWVVVRDLGTEGAGLADVALRDAIAAGIVAGPLVIPTTRALVATGCYGPNLAAAATPKGAQVADGADGIRRAVREQIAAGAQWIKVYADYRRAPGAPATPTYTQEELAAACEEAASAGLAVAAHATTDEGMRRSVLAGVRTIEHGSGASEATLQLMVQKGVVLCPCLAANEAVLRYAGRRGAAVDRLNPARVAFQRALAAGVAIACGSDAGVFTHGENAREVELMVEFGMTPVQALAAATATAAKVLGRADLGRIDKGARPGLVVLSADPLQDPANLRKVTAVRWGRQWRP
ncbi:MAG TPA: amidohydrolase family protein [Planctomycetota bacterium]|nr:amidohydrolase family protein [Planctomycetota bacterium]